MQCSAWVVLGTSSWAATDAFPVFAKMSPNASVAPAAHRAAIDEPRELPPQNVGAPREVFAYSTFGTGAWPWIYAPSVSSTWRSARPAASQPRPSAMKPRERPAASEYDSRQPSSSLVGGRAISPSITSVIRRWPVAYDHPGGGSVGQADAPVNRCAHACHLRRVPQWQRGMGG
eukprot:scaffold113977_cov28-Tisochrysis_lutea.AAC.9